MTKQQILRSIAFFLVVGLMLVLLCDLFEQKNTENYDQTFYTYRNYPENTIDAVYIGTSGVDRYWIAAKAYEEYGMTVYPLSSDAMPCWLFTIMLDEALAHQNPELILLDIRAFAQENGKETVVEITDPGARRVLDGLELFSLNRLRAGLRTMEKIHAADPSAPRFDISYLLSFVKYHSAWSGDDFLFTTNLRSRSHKYAGFYASDWLSTQVQKQTPVVYDETYCEPLSVLSEMALYEVLDYIREKDLKVLFVDTPQFLEPIEMGRVNQVYRILEEEGFDYLTFYAPGPEGGFTVELDPETDFYNSGHVNYFGAEKFTPVLAAYLHEHYDLPDRRNDETVKAHWDGVYDALTEFFSTLEIIEVE